ncbi:MAG: hypothetical protein AB9836_08430 [Aminipila sp.]
MVQKTFNEKGFEVSRGFINTTVYEAAACDLLLVLNPDNYKDSIAEFKNSPFAYYSGIRVENIYDLEFLVDFPNLLYLEVISDKPVNTNGIETLHNIRGLQIFEPKNGLDFRNFPHLEVFEGKWHKNNRNIGDCRDLRSILISNYNSKTKDFSELKNIVRLEYLQIIRSNIETLKGIETLKDLKYLMLAYATKLKDISEISKTNLREIEFDVLNSIEEYHFLGDIDYLRKMIIYNCSDMQNINWISKMKHLDFFSFVDTNVVDGNLSPLIQLPELRYTGTLDKKHYNLKEQEINNYLFELHNKSSS